MEFNIPLEIKDKSAFPQLKKNDRLTIAYAVLFGVGNQEAFMRFNPHYIDASGKAMNPAGKKASTMFWNYGKVKDYRQTYEEELSEFLGRKSTPKSEIIGEIDESRKDKALKSLLNQAMSLVEGSGDLDAETLKIAAEIFKKVGLLKDEVEQQVRPLRFLPERCGSCRARIFVESAVANGDVLDMCLYCKARRAAEENGYRFESNNLLDIPKEVIAEIEAKNNVKVSDILSGKVEN